MFSLVAHYKHFRGTCRHWKILSRFSISIWKLAFGLVLALKLQGEATKELLHTLSAKLITSMELNLCLNHAAEQGLSFMCRFLYIYIKRSKLMLSFVLECKGSL
jgi:hypothetical protein